MFSEKETNNKMWVLTFAPHVNPSGRGGESLAFSRARGVSADGRAVLGRGGAAGASVGTGSMGTASCGAVAPICARHSRCWAKKDSGVHKQGHMTTGQSVET